MIREPPKPIVHLELHTGDGAAASDFLARACGWRTEVIDLSEGSYRSLDVGGAGVGGGVVECPTPRPLWLPYVEVERIDEATERARQVGARVLLAPREGPAGWRSVVSAPAGGEVAFWQPKR
jgi:predicted enzyme related to lactoylglutathione lyase